MCEFCGYSTCASCNQKTREFPLWQKGPPGGDTRGRCCKLCDRKFLIRTLIEDTTSAIKINSQVMISTQKLVDSCKDRNDAEQARLDEELLKQQDGFTVIDKEIALQEEAIDKQRVRLDRKNNVLDEKRKINSFLQERIDLNKQQNYLIKQEIENHEQLIRDV